MKRLEECPAVSIYRKDNKNRIRFTVNGIDYVIRRYENISYLYRGHMCVPFTSIEVTRRTIKFTNKRETSCMIELD